uniref:Uncharacterized protein n=1 Tax=Monopterus albus TaxID=43700 RepID=A0A3Q3IMZ0_MONAL
PKDLQHICRYPAMEQYRRNTSIRQNVERSARQRCPGDTAGENQPIIKASILTFTIIKETRQGGRELRK